MACSDGMGAPFQLEFDAFAELLPQSEERHTYPLRTAPKHLGKFVRRQPAPITLFEQSAQILVQFRHAFLEIDRLVSLLNRLYCLREFLDLCLLETRKIHLLPGKPQQLLSHQIPSDGAQPWTKRLSRVEFRNPAINEHAGLVRNLICEVRHRKLQGHQRPQRS